MPGADVATSWGIFGVTVTILLAVMAAVGKWGAAELARRQAAIDRKDALLEQAFPLLANVSESVNTMNQRSQSLLDVVVSRARER